jgi:hypothetical protein
MKHLALFNHPRVRETYNGCNHLSFFMGLHPCKGIVHTVERGVIKEVIPVSNVMALIRGWRLSDCEFDPRRVRVVSMGDRRDFETLKRIGR